MLRNPEFNGSNYSKKFDYKRLSCQLDRVKAFMRPGIWATLSEISDATGDPQASISAQLRHLRKKKFGSFIVDKRLRGEPKNGLWEYRVRSAR